MMLTVVLREVWIVATQIPRMEVGDGVAVSLMAFPPVLSGCVESVGRPAA